MGNTVAAAAPALVRKFLRELRIASQSYALRSGCATGKAVSALFAVARLPARNLWCRVPETGMDKRSPAALLQDFKLEDDRFASDHEAEVILPETTEGSRVVHSELETEQLPQPQQLDVDALLAHT